MAKNHANLETDTVDLGDGNGNNLHQPQLSESVAIMELEAFLMEFPLYVGWILGYYFADTIKGELIVGLKFHKCPSLLSLKCKETSFLLKRKGESI